jgi:LysR family transcriptional regulator of beta-lactamase
MIRPHLPLNALRAFEASARHLSFTRAAVELFVTPAAVSHQVKSLEAQLNVTLFKRLPRGLMLTSEGETLLPVLRESFDRIAETLERFEGGHYRDVLTVGAVGTFAVGWLLPRLADFQEKHPFIDLRLSTNNNRVDVAAEGLDYAIRFGAGAWHGIEALRLIEAPLSVLCVPELARQLNSPEDLLKQTLLRSYRTDEWPEWFLACGLPPNTAPTRNIVFDSSLAMMEAALQAAGIALAPPLMFSRQLAAGAIEQPFAIGITTGSYWLTRLQSRPETAAMTAFKEWLLQASKMD